MGQGGGALIEKNYVSKFMINIFDFSTTEKKFYVTTKLRGEEGGKGF